MIYEDCDFFDNKQLPVASGWQIGLAKELVTVVCLLIIITWSSSDHTDQQINVNVIIIFSCILRLEKPRERIGSASSYYFNSGGGRGFPGKLGNSRYIQSVFN